MNAQSSLTRRNILMVTSATLATAGLPEAITAPARAQSLTQRGTMPTQPPAEIITLINTALEAFNRKDAAVFNSVFGGDVVIVDGFTPFRWIGPNAEARWWADAETWGKAGGVVKEHISFEGIRSWEVSGTRAYAVLSATLTITLKAGEPIVRRVSSCTLSQGKAMCGRLRDIRGVA